MRTTSQRSPDIKTLVPEFRNEEDVAAWVADHRHGLGSFMLDLLLSEVQLSPRSAAVARRWITDNTPSRPAATAPGTATARYAHEAARRAEFQRLHAPPAKPARRVPPALVAIGLLALVPCMAWLSRF